MIAERSCCSAVCIGWSLALIVVWHSAVAQENQSGIPSRTVRIGVGAMGGVGVHVAQMSSLPELVTCCPQFRDGSGLTTVAHVWGEYPLLPPFSLGLRVGTNTLTGQLRALERKPVLVDDQPTEALIQHSLTATLAIMRWEGYITLRTSSLLDVYVGVGTDLIRRAEASIHEELVQPSTGTFENGQRTRNEQSQALTSATRSVTSLVAGMRFSLPLTPSMQWLLVPELSFRYALDPVVPLARWYIYSVHVGASLAFQSLPVLSAPATPEQPPPPPPPASLPLEASIVAYGAEATREPLPIRSQQQLRLRRLPLLPVVYMDGMQLPPSYLLPERPEDTSWHATLHSPLGAYYAIVPLLGERLRATTDTLTLVGIDGLSRTRALARASALAHYLQSVWEIDPGRLRVAARIDEQDTSARVLLQGSSRILAPVLYDDTVTTLSPRTLRLRPATNGSVLLYRWSLRLVQDSTEVAIQRGTGGLPLRIDVSLEDLAERIRVGTRLVAQLDVEGVNGVRASAQTVIPIDRSSHPADTADEVIALFEYFLFPTERFSAETAEQLATLYLWRLRDIAIVRYGSSLELDDAVAHLQSLLERAGFPEPRIERRSELYRPLTPERRAYSNLLLLQLRYVY